MRARDIYCARLGNWDCEKAPVSEHVSRHQLTAHHCCCQARILSKALGRNQLQLHHAVEGQNPVLRCALLWPPSETRVRPHAQIRPAAIGSVKTLAARKAERWTAVCSLNACIVIILELVEALSHTAREEELTRACLPR